MLQKKREISESNCRSVDFPFLSSWSYQRDPLSSRGYTRFGSGRSSDLRIILLAASSHLF